MDIKEYVVVAIMTAVWIILQILKKPIFEKFRMNDYIPLFAALLGIVFTFWINGEITFTLFLQGIASGFSATGLNEGINAVFKGDSDAE